MIDVNKYLLPPTSNGRSDPLPQTAVTTTTRFWWTVIDDSYDYSIPQSCFFDVYYCKFCFYLWFHHAADVCLVTLPSASQSQTLAASTVDLLPPPPGVSSAMQASTTSMSQPVPAATPSQPQTYTTASVSVGSSTAATPSIGQTAPTQPSVTATTATAAMAAPIVLVRQQQQVKPYSGQSS